ncbi:unnamed protein product [Orchesella dallaii]|uniref:Homeobox domain-containing protein n=1 Tax=Orchesella dallaii TaxID=48710 RepID=A0ABP1PMX7_9HEXA
MFDLAIATQRYSQPQQPQLGYPIQHPHYTSTHPPQLHHNPDRKQQSNHLQIPLGNNNNIGGPTMDDCSGITTGVRDDREFVLNYPRSPQSETSQKSHDSSSPASTTADATASVNLSTRAEISPVMYSSAQNQLNFFNPGVVAPSKAETGERSHPATSGKQCSKKQGPAGDKPSFSIESLLAHSNNWRRHPQSQDNKSVSKDSRFLPYSIPQQAPQQNRTPRQSSESKTTSNIPQSEEKRTENFGAGNKCGNGRRAAKSKRVRTIFTPEQLERLEAEFERQQYMVGPERLYLASSLYLTEAQVKVWFQNRRIKWRKQHLEMEQQRLALYRTLTEQDMMTSADPDDSGDCDYEDEDGTDEDRRSIHSPPQPNNPLSTMQPEKTADIQHPLPSHHQHHQPPINNKQLKNMSSVAGNSSSSFCKTDHHRIPLQQQSNNDEFDTSTPTSSVSSSLSLSPASFPRTGMVTRNEEETMTTTCYPRNTVQQLKK